MHRRVIPSEILWVSALALVAIVMLQAWIHEDAYITFRVVDNAIHGYGLRWNVDERVQVYTHPLWMLLLIPLNVIISDIRFAALALSIACVLIAYLVVGWQLRQRPMMLAIGFALPLLLSDAFKDYATAGLENPLSYALVAGFIVCSLSEEIPWFWLCLWAALGMVTRLDTVIIYAPMLVFLLCQHKVHWKEAIAGFLPIILWLIFSLIYYGFLLPNTYYSKLSASFPLSLYLQNGWDYTRDLWFFSPITACVLLLGIAHVGYWMEKKEWRYAMLGVGFALYCLYVIYIGGDYMSGRMWSVPFFGFTALLSLASRSNRQAYFYLLVIVILCVIQPAIRHPNNITHDISDERHFRIGTCMFCKEGVKPEDIGWAKQGLEYRAHPRVGKEGSVGIMGYYAGPKTTIIDFIGITDPLIARLPVSGRFRIGHFGRRVPKGYVEARESGDLSKFSPSLQQYYAALRTVTAGSIWSRERWNNIILFQIGFYKPWIAWYQRELALQ